MNVLVCPNYRKEGVGEATAEVCAVLYGLGFSVYMDLSFLADNLNKVTYCEINTAADKCDIIITIGGDGTILKWGKFAAKRDKPLLGINMGRLGFMATLEYSELNKLSKLADNSYSIDKRMLLDVTICSENTDKKVALNDVVIYKHTLAKLPEFSIRSNDTEVSRLHADGLIFSTPTGSTAYSLSAGGPIIEPDLDCIEFTPLCAHTLFARTMIFSSSKKLRISYNTYDSDVFISIDGDDGILLNPEDYVIIEKSNLSVGIIDIDGVNFYNSIHNKLMKPLK